MLVTSRPHRAPSEHTPKPTRSPPPPLRLLQPQHLWRLGPGHALGIAGSSAASQASARDISIYRPMSPRGQHRTQRRTTALGKTAEHVQRPASSDLWELRPSPWPTGPAGPRPPRVQHERPLFPLPPAVRVRALPTTRGGRQRGASGHAPGVHPTPPPLCCPLPDLASSLPCHKLSCFVSLFVDGFISFLAPRSRGLSLPSALVPQDPKQGRGVGNPGPQTSRRDGGFSRV